MPEPVPEEVEPIIRFSVRDLLDRMSSDIAAGFARVEASLGAKADKADLAELHGEMRTVIGRVSALEKHRDDNEVALRVRELAQSKRDAWFKFAIPAGLTATYTILALVEAHIL